MARTARWTTSSLDLVSAIRAATRRAKSSRSHLRKDERGEGAERVVAVEVAVGGAQADEQAERLFGEAIGVEAGARCAYEFDGGTRYWWGSPFHRG